MYAPNYDYYSAETTNSPTMDWWQRSPQMNYYKPNAIAGLVNTSGLMETSGVAGIVNTGGLHKMGMLNLDSNYYKGAHMGFIGGMGMPSTSMIVAGLGALIALSSLVVKGKDKKKKKLKKIMLGSGAVMSVGGIAYNQFVE